MSIRACIVEEADGTRTLVTNEKDSDVTHLAEQIVNKVDLNRDDSKCYHAKGHLFNYIVEDEVCYFCVAAENCKRRLCFAFLTVVKQEYMKKYRGKVTSDGFKSYIRTQLDYFNNNPEADKIKSILQQVDEVKEIALSNIDKLLEREGRLEELTEMSEELETSSGEFARASRQLKRKFCFENIRLTICLIIALVVLVLVIATIIFLAIFIPLKAAKSS